jgi:caffeoyl-CoA O-methyltransferase
MPNKEGYDAYLSWALDHVRRGGLIAAHNALRRGAVTDPQTVDPQAQIMRQFNQRMATEPRLLSLLYPVGDGTVIGLVK